MNSESRVPAGVTRRALRETSRDMKCKMMTDDAESDLFIQALRLFINDQIILIQMKIGLGKYLYDPSFEGSNHGFVAEFQTDFFMSKQY